MTTRDITNRLKTSDLFFPPKDQNTEKFDPNGLYDLLENFVEHQVGLDVGSYSVRHNNTSIGVGTSFKGIASEWEPAAQQLIEELERNGFGKWKLTTLTGWGIGLEKS